MNTENKTGQARLKRKLKIHGNIKDYLYPHTEFFSQLCKKNNSSYVVFIIILGLNYFQGNKILNCVNRAKIVLFKKIYLMVF